MPSKPTTNVHIILDRSGSMSTVQDATIDAINEYVNSLKKDKKSTYKLTLTTFDAPVNGVVLDKLYKQTPLTKVKALNRDTYQPRGMTPLYDAACMTIKDVEDTKGKNLVVIMTDGLENASKEFTQKELAKIIADLEAKKNWTFVFLGANQDAYATAQQFGIALQNTSNFNATAKGLSSTSATMAINTAMFASSPASATQDFFSKEDQQDLEDSA